MQKLRLFYVCECVISWLIIPNSLCDSKSIWMVLRPGKQRIRGIGRVHCASILRTSQSWSNRECHRPAGTLAIIVRIVWEWLRKQCPGNRTLLKGSPNTETYCLSRFSCAYRPSCELSLCLCGLGRRSRPDLFDSAQLLLREYTRRTMEVIRQRNSNIRQQECDDILLYVIIKAPKLSLAKGTNVRRHKGVVGRLKDYCQNQAWRARGAAGNNQLLGRHLWDTLYFMENKTD